MEDAKTQLEALIELGNNFTYDNFSSKDPYGYPAVRTSGWVGWVSRVQSVTQKLFGAGSPQDAMVVQALRVPVIGNGPDKFEECKSYLLGALKNACEIIDNDIFNELQTEKKAESRLFGNNVFVVHGHDEKSKHQLEIFLSEIGLEPIVLHRQPDEGQTIIEKFEKHSDVGFAFILLTPDEVTYLIDQELLEDSKRKKEFRARPNVIFEFGYFVGKLGRPRVCCLYKGDVTLPSDVSGIIYKKFNSEIEEVAYSIIKDLKACGYSLK